jgi:hypothetical protein
MPAKLEKCVADVSKTVKPRPGQTAKSAAWGICQVSVMKKGIRHGKSLTRKTKSGKKKLRKSR